VGRDGLVCIASRYGLDGPGIDSRWRRDFLRPSRPSLGPTSLLFNGHLEIPRGKAAWAWRWPRTPLAPRLKRVELYFYSPSGTSWQDMGWNLYIFTLLRRALQATKKCKFIGWNVSELCCDIKIGCCVEVYVFSIECLVILYDYGISLTIQTQ
jgi:hypothetical protein